MTARAQLFAAAGIVGLSLQPAPLLAQTLPRGAGWGATMVIEPVIIAHGGFSALCNPRAAAQAGWGVEQIEKLVIPTGPQQAVLDELKRIGVDFAQGFYLADPQSNEQLP